MAVLAQLIGVWIDGPKVELVPASTPVQLDIPRGTDGTVVVSLVDSTGDLLDLDLAGADRLKLSVRQTFAAGVLLEVFATKDAELGRYLFALASNGTIDLSGRLVYDVWATRAGAQQQVIGAGYFNVTPRIASPP